MGRERGKGEREGRVGRESGKGEREERVGRESGKPPNHDPQTTCTNAAVPLPYQTIVISDIR